MLMNGSAFQKGHLTIGNEQRKDVKSLVAKILETIL